MYDIDMNDLTSRPIPDLLYLVVGSGRTLTTMLDERLSPLQLSAAKYFMMMALEESEEACTITMLAEGMGTGKSNITPLVDRLENDGLARRERDQHDRRQVFVRLTDTGRERLKQARQLVATVSDDMKTLYSAEETMMLSGLLARFVERYCFPP
jgi:DNA-binding MarR family transcriptional regulator